MRIESVNYPWDGHCESERNKAFQPHFDCYRQEPFTRPLKEPAIIIIPGGGYHFCSEREGEPVALHFMENGYRAFVVWYSVHPASYPKPLKEVAYTVQYIREHADELDVDPERIFLLGFSAGGHLTAAYGTFYGDEELLTELKTTKEMLRPTGVLLSYPVITFGEGTHIHTRDYALENAGERWTKERLSLEKSISPDNVPVFIWSTFPDQAVPVLPNTLAYAKALYENHIPVELHIYPEGAHGASLNTRPVSFSEDMEKLTLSSWPALALAWMKSVQ